MKRITRHAIPNRDRRVLDALGELGGAAVPFSDLRDRTKYSDRELNTSLDRLINYGRVHFRFDDDGTLWSLSRVAESRAAQ